MPLKNLSRTSPITLHPGVAEAPHHNTSRRFTFPLQFLSGIAIGAEPEWLIKGLMPARGLLVLYGRPGSGKSFLALDVALHLAAGRPWGGVATRQSGVIYVASEASQGMRKRVVAALEHHGMSRSLPFALVTVAPDLGQRDNSASRLAEEILEQIPKGFNPGLIVLDTLARSMVGADESGATGMGVFIENAEALGRALNALVMPIHHMGKDRDKGMRGSSALLGAADAVWEIPPEGGRRLTVVKMKEDADNVSVPFKLCPFTVGHDHEGTAITTCVVSIGAKEAEVAQSAVDVAKGVSGSTDAFSLTLKTVIETHGQCVQRFRHIPKEVKAIRQADLVTFTEFAPGAGSAKSRQSIIGRQIREMENAGRVERHKGYVWLVEAKT
jgi:hypothetical protein